MTDLDQLREAVAADIVATNGRCPRWQPPVTPGARVLPLTRLHGAPVPGGPVVAKVHDTDSDPGLWVEADDEFGELYLTGWAVVGDAESGPWPLPGQGAVILRAMSPEYVGAILSVADRLHSGVIYGPYSHGTVLSGDQWAIIPSAGPDGAVPKARHWVSRCTSGLVLRLTLEREDMDAPDGLVALPPILTGQRATKCLSCGERHDMLEITEAAHAALDSETYPEGYRGEWGE